MNGYVVRTKSGNRGPYSPQQLEELVENGKLPETLRVYDAETGDPIDILHAISGAPPAEAAPLPEPATESGAGTRPRRELPRRGTAPRGTAPRGTVPRGSQQGHGRRAPARGQLQRKGKGGKIVVWSIVSLLVLGLLAFGAMNVLVVRGLESTAEKITENAPTKIDENVTLTGATAGPGSVLTVRYELANIVASETDRTRIEATIRENMVRRLKTQPNVGWAKLFGIEFIGEFRDFRGDLIGRVRISASDAN